MICDVHLGFRIFSIPDPDSWGQKCTVPDPGFQIWIRNTEITYNLVEIVSEYARTNCICRYVLFYYQICGPDTTLGCQPRILNKQLRFQFLNKQTNWYRYRYSMAFFLS
jgi:hypothetical protein